LKLDRVAPGGNGYVDQSLGDAEIAVVINANLGNHIDRASIADSSFA
jgi:hypothetical protein